MAASFVAPLISALVTDSQKRKRTRKRIHYPRASGAGPRISVSAFASNASSRADPFSGVPSAAAPGFQNPRAHTARPLWRMRQPLEPVVRRSAARRKARGSLVRRGLCWGVRDAVSSGRAAHARSGVQSAAHRERFGRHTERVLSTREGWAAWRVPLRTDGRPRELLLRRAVELVAQAKHLRISAGRFADTDTPLDGYPRVARLALCKSTRKKAKRERQGRK